GGGGGGGRGGGGGGRRRGGGGRGRGGRGRGRCGRGRRRAGAGGRRRCRRTATGVDRLPLAVEERETGCAVRGAVMDEVVDDVVARIVPVRAVGDDARLARAHIWPVRRREHESDGACCSRTPGQGAADGGVAELAALEDDI